MLVVRRINKARVILQNIIPFCASYVALGILSAFMYYYRKPHKVKA